MKKIIILLSFLTITAISIFAQNSLNNSKLDGFNFSSTFIDKNYSQNHFLRGLNWGFGDKGLQLDIGYDLNTYHHYAYYSGTTNFPSTNYNPNFRSMTPISERLHTSRKQFSILSGLGLYLEPALNVSQSGTFSPNVEADYGAVFGFQSKSGGSNKIVTVGSKTFGCYHVSNTVSSGTILSDIWRGDFLRFCNYNGMNTTDQINFSGTVNQNGVNWNLSINLRNSETFPSGLSDNDVVLRLKIPYSGTFNSSDMSGYIKFSSMPQVSGTFANDVFDINGSNTFIFGSDFRGLARNNSSLSTLTTNFDITVGMLRTAAADNNSHDFITLSARFICDNDLDAFDNFRKNPFFLPNHLADPIHIKKVDVEVEYVNNTLPIDINWIRIETPNLQKLYRGEYDELILNELNTLASMYSSSLNTANAKISRFYFNDELTPIEWEQFRYMNLLLDTMAISETFIPNNLNLHQDCIIPHFYFATGSKELWNGFTTNQMAAQSPPYLRKTLGKENPKTFNYPDGYTTFISRYDWNTSIKSIIDNMVKDTIKSLYETFFFNGSATMGYCHPSPFSASFSEIGGVGYSVQHFTDYMLNKTICENPYAYYEKPYLSNIWIDFYFMLSTISNTSTTQSILGTQNWETRPKTGQEINYNVMSEIIKGSKGLFIWSKEAHPSADINYYTENSTTATGKLENPALFATGYTNPSLTLDEFLYGDEPGGDFIKLSDDQFGYDKFYAPYSSTFYDLDLMNIKKDRMYIGSKSTRTELYKILKWTQAVEPTLLKLNLIAYKNKGFVEFSNAKPSSTYNIAQFIDTANIRTRPLGRTSATTTGGITNYIPYYENSASYSSTFSVVALRNKMIDSAFYEVSILKNSGSSTENEFYIGIQNRRTDPLLTFSETITTPSGNTFDNSMKFYTTAELDKMASSTAPSYSYNTSSSVSGTVTSIVNGFSRTYTSPYPPEFWQQQWWQRLGCREIRIPINIAGLSNTNTMTMLKVTELGVGESIANEWWWDSKFRHNVDTAVIKGNDLVVRMLPGEGKILRVQVIRLNEGTTVLGHLDRPNQNKIVSFSSSQTMSMTDRSNPNEVRYHMVYQKYFNENPNPAQHNIFYRRSKPVTKDIASYTTAIDWEAEKPLNLTTIDYEGNFSTCGNSSTFLRYNVPSFHPNIVVRVDSTDVNAPVPKVYVVYSGYGTSNSATNGHPNNLVIIESVFNANDANQIGTSEGRVIAKAASTGYDQPNDYGLTAINASYQGNYYAWNDINLGIVAGFKKSGDPCLQATLQVTNNCSNSFPLNSHFNPSMNTYSRIPYYDVDAALVWSANSSTFGAEGMYGGFGQSRIAYTRLWYDNNTNTLINRLGSNTCGWEHTETFERYPCDEDIYYFSKLNYINSQKYPVVYRNVEFFNSATSTYYDPYRANKNDHVYWQGNDWDNKGVIFHSTISNWDINPSGTFYNQPDCIGAIYSAHIRHEQWNLYSPTAAQGTLRRSNNEFFADADPSDPWGFEARTNDLDFISGTSATVTTNNSIWHIPHGWQSLWMGWTYLLGNFDNYPLSMQTHTLGVTFPHLSKQMTFSTDQEKKFNRRIYNESYNSSTQTRISSSLEYFFKDNIDENAQSGIGFFGFDNGKERSYFTGISIVQNGITENLKINFLKNTEKGKVIEDTVNTNWFTISNNDQVNFIINNNDNSDRFKFYLQRKSDRKLIKLFKYQTKSDLFKQGLIFKSDTTDTYRLIWFDSNLKTFTQELLLGNKAVMMKKERANPDFVTFVDLRNGTQIDSKSEEDLLLSIYPNPATNKFSIYTGLNRSMASQSRCKVEIKVINQLGLVLMSKIIPLGEVVTYDSEDLPSGQYFVQVEMLEGFDGSCEHFMNVKPVSIVK